MTVRELLPCSRCNIRLTSFGLCTQCWFEDKKEAERKAKQDKDDIIDALYTG